MRDVPNRYRGLAPRTPEMLRSIVRKFYRGAVSHYDLIQLKKADVRQALAQAGGSSDEESRREIARALHTLFLEFHFYVTCWLQIEMALYRLAREDERYARIMQRFGCELQTHVTVRHHLDQTEECVRAQWDEERRTWLGAERDQYRFGEILFTVDEKSLASLHELYEAVQAVSSS
ncbi:hypothetical protein KDJ56_16865 [Brevibacillus composti]|uniref:Uncharacterized protein n=1 Tax=Brevibacillus composti TaxID=2796470 RepID=A0A7T5EJ64_9BACL|nr:hypothetical protein [Brevibacillus composti]QQE73557.1 hypothetical protein JD108_16920 [Brevibacillus composti]QUO40639.1 hypothetical protein KDJ56_16865 [Brevibacillus composti]